jgi:hypothetical protein
MRRLMASALAALCATLTPVALSVDAGHATPSDAAATCATTTRVGFARYREKQPPNATHELRAVVSTACRRAPVGRCLFEVFDAGRYVEVSSYATTPLPNGRCRFILPLEKSFPPTRLRIRFVGVGGFGSSQARITVTPSTSVAFPRDQAYPAATAGLKLAGFAFVDSTVTGQGSKATLPPGTRVYPSGSRIAGTTGCPTNQYGTDGLLVLVIDYDGSPTAASVVITVTPEGGGLAIQRAPYYLDLDPGRALQYLGPETRNGTLQVVVTTGVGGLQTKAGIAKATLVLARSCP